MNLKTFKKLYEFLNSPFKYINASNLGFINLSGQYPIDGFGNPTTEYGYGFEAGVEFILDKIDSIPDIREEMLKDA